MSTGTGKERKRAMFRLGLLEYNFDHLIADPCRLGKAWRKIGLDLLKAIAIG